MAFADVIEIDPAAGEAVNVPQDPPHLRVLLLDAWIVAVAKPAGVATQPPRRRRPGELTLHELATLELSRREGRRSETTLVHRLDRPTTGVVVFARHRRASRALAAAWRDGTVEKTYLALVHGDPGAEPFTVDAPIGRDPGASGRFRVAPTDGRAARTDVVPLVAGDGVVLVAALPRTGRSHQIRVHLAHHGHPVVGDARYGGSEAARPLLHAWKLRLPHPSGRGTVDLEAPLPPDLTAYLAARGIDPADPRIGVTPTEPPLP